MVASEGQSLACTISQRKSKEERIAFYKLSHTLSCSLSGFLVFAKKQKWRQASMNAIASKFIACFLSSSFKKY
ncbi:hypothetical protein NEOC95_001486 [Neochlamydia sp. AcF95]|nr:hypothetical protein [Neochlamydia sp. AcF95]